MSEGTPRPRRARPVADAPIDALLERAEDLTKGWLIALLEQHELDDAPAIVASDVARDGPRVCAAVVRALGSDADLERIDQHGALEPLVSRAGSFAGVGGVEAISRAVDALASVIWSAVRDELVRPDADQVSELAERLARVIELVRLAALRRIADDDAGAAAASARPVAAVSDAAVSGPDPVPTAPLMSAVPDPEPAPDADDVADAAISWPPETGRRELGGDRTAGSSSPDPLWMGALHDELVRAQRTGSPLSLLLVELEDADRVVAADGEHEASATFGRFARAVRGVARRQDILACESDARAWVIARDTARPGARALGERIISAVREAHEWRGAPLTVSLGVAVFGEDGRDGDDLIQAAEEAMFVAAASGSEIGDGVGESPSGAGPEFVG